MKADPAVLKQLLALQQIDTHMDRLKYLRDTMPEAARARELSAQESTAGDELVRRRTELADLEREVRKYEGEVDKVRARAAKDSALLESGQVTTAKHLQDLQHEIASLARRQTELEDLELEMLEQVESAQRQVLAAETEHQAATAAAAEAVAARDAAMRTLAADFQESKVRRGALVPQIPAELLSLYERLRSDLGGLAVAEFENGQCTGCRLELIPADRAAIATAPLDEVVRCEECRRVLVRASALPT